MSGAEMAKFVAATLRDKVVHEVSEENETLRRENRRLLELLEGVLQVDLIHATTGEKYAGGELHYLDCYNAFSWFCELHFNEDVTLSMLLSSTCHIVISGRFFDALEWNKVTRAGLFTRPEGGLTFWSIFQEDSKFASCHSCLNVRGFEDLNLQQYEVLADQCYEFVDVNKSIGDLLSVHGDKEVETVSISLKDEHRILRRPDWGIRN